MMKAICLMFSVAVIAFSASTLDSFKRTDSDSMAGAAVEKIAARRTYKSRRGDAFKRNQEVAARRVYKSRRGDAFRQTS